MKNNIERQNKIVLFQSRKIRRAWHSDEWYFSLVDIVGALTDSSNPTDYLKKIRKGDEELGSYIGTNCPRVEMLTETGKKRKTLAGNARDALRLIQSIPSKKAEPFKHWLAQIGKERLDEIENMCTLKGEENKNSFYEPHLCLQNTSESINVKEAGKGGAEFPPDPPSAPAAFWSWSFEKNWRGDLSVLVNHYSGWTESLGQDLKIWLRIFLKKSSNFGQKTQPGFTFCKTVRGFPGALCLAMIFFRYNPGIFEVAHQRAVGNTEVSALKRNENKVFQNQSFFFRLWRKV